MRRGYQNGTHKQASSPLFFSCFAFGFLWFFLFLFLRLQMTLGLQEPFWGDRSRFLRCEASHLGLDFRIVCFCDILHGCLVSHAAHEGLWAHCSCSSGSISGCACGSSSGRDRSSKISCNQSFIFCQARVSRVLLLNTFSGCRIVVGMKFNKINVLCLLGDDSRSWLPILKCQGWRLILLFWQCC